MKTNFGILLTYLLIIFGQTSYAEIKDGVVALANDGHLDDVKMPSLQLLDPEYARTDMHLNEVKEFAAIPKDLTMLSRDMANDERDRPEYLRGVTNKRIDLILQKSYSVEATDNPAVKALGAKGILIVGKDGNKLRSLEDLPVGELACILYLREIPDSGVLTKGSLLSSKQKVYSSTVDLLSGPVSKFVCVKKNQNNQEEVGTILGEPYLERLSPFFDEKEFSEVLKPVFASEAVADLKRMRRKKSYVEEKEFSSGTNNRVLHSSEN